MNKKEGDLVWYWVKEDDPSESQQGITLQNETKKGFFRMPVFEVVIIEEPSQNARDDGAMEKLVLGPVAVVAKDANSAGTVVAMEHADQLRAIDKGRMKTLCRPFV
jgi:hypothetical protein